MKWLREKRYIENSTIYRVLNFCIGLIVFENFMASMLMVVLIFLTKL